MRRPVILVALAALLLGACGSGVSESEDSASIAPAVEDVDEFSAATTAASAYDAAARRAAAPSAYDAAAGSATSAEASGLALPERPFVAPADDARSTFAIDVDSGSYTMARAMLRAGQRPDPALVRTEEFVNYFDMDYDAPGKDAFAIHADGAQSPVTDDPRHRILRVGLQSRVPDGERAPAVLTFVVDVSGSMEAPNKLDLVRDSLVDFVGDLRPDDTVGMVVYGDDARVVLEPTPVAEAATVVDAVRSLRSEGSTNAEAGLRAGYRMARSHFRDGAVNRVVLASDGVANVGAVSPDAILAQVREDAAKGIQLVTLGFGMGEYNDPLMEQLADDGDGFYVYVDGPREAERVLRTNLVATLVTVALDAKVQVTFDPATVAKYRLLGYDNRAVADDEFRDDTVDGGEVGAGHSVTALYDVELVDGAAPDAPVATVALRWKTPGSLEAVELERDVAVRDLDSGLEDADVRFQLAVAAAMFAEVLRTGEASGIGYDRVERHAAEVAGRLSGDLDAQELVELARLAGQLA